MFLKKLFLCFIVIGFLQTAVVKAQPLNVTEILEAVCRITVRGSMGSGTCFDYKNGKYYILTNAHVVGNNTTGNVEFFKFGHKTKLLPASIIWKVRQERTPVDFAILTVEDKYFGKYPPRVIPLVSENVVPKTGEYIYSAGCPGGTWPKGWEGFVVANEEGRIIFHPPPVGGQSGSGLLVVVKGQKDYETRIAGIVTWRIGPLTVQTDSSGYEKAKGGAVLIDTLYKAQQGKVSAFKRIPDSYIEMNQRYGLGSDGKIYPIVEYSDGTIEAVVPPNVRIIDWNIKCPPGGCLPKILPRWKGGDYFNQPNPKPEEAPPGPLPLPTPPSGDNNPSPVPPSSGDSPYGNPPKWYGEEEDKTKQLEAEIEKYKASEKALQEQIATRDAKIKELDTNIATLNNHQKELLQKIADGIKQIESLGEQLKSKESNNTNLESKLEEEKKKVENALNDVANLNTKIENLSTTVEDKDTALTEAQQESDSKVTISSFLASTGGAAILPIIFYLLWYWWKKKGGRKKIQAAMDKVEDKIQGDISKVVGNDLAQQARDNLDNLETRIGGIIEKYLGGLQTGSTLDDVLKNFKIDITSQFDDALKDIVSQFDTRVTKLEDTKTTVVDEPIITTVPLKVDEISPASSENIKALLEETFNKLKNELTDNFEKRLAEKIPNSVTNVIHLASAVTDQNETTQEETDLANLPTTPQGEEYLKQFFALKAKDGESVKHWAVFAQLYREAIAELRKGNLYYNGNTKLQGQARTADAIDNWVRQEFLKNLTIEEAKNTNTLNKDAMLGVLYKDAVDNLRNGKMDVLGSEATATAIQSWVEKEFLRRMGIKL